LPSTAPTLSLTLINVLLTHHGLQIVAVSHGFGTEFLRGLCVSAEPHIIIQRVLGILVPFLCLAACHDHTKMDSLSSKSPHYGFIFTYGLFWFAFFAWFIAHKSELVIAALAYVILLDCSPSAWSFMVESGGGGTSLPLAFVFDMWTDAGTSWHGMAVFANAFFLGLVFLLLNVVFYTMVLSITTTLLFVGRLPRWVICLCLYVVSCCILI
jgi:hypothetical protein